MLASLSIEPSKRASGWRRSCKRRGDTRVRDCPRIFLMLVVTYLQFCSSHPSFSRLCSVSCTGWAKEKIVNCGSSVLSRQSPRALCFVLVYLKNRCLLSPQSAFIIYILVCFCRTRVPLVKKTTVAAFRYFSSARSCVPIHLPYFGHWGGGGGGGIF